VGFPISGDLPPTPFATIPFRLFPKPGSGWSHPWASGLTACCPEAANLLVPLLAVREDRAETVTESEISSLGSKAS